MVNVSSCMVPAQIYAPNLAGAAAAAATTTAAAAAAAPAAVSAEWFALEAEFCPPTHTPNSLSTPPCPGDCGFLWMDVNEEANLWG